MSYHRTPDRSDQHLPPRSPSWGSCRHQWGHPLVSSSLSWTNLEPLLEPLLVKSCPLVFSPSSLPSFRHILVFLYLSYIVEPKTAHSTGLGWPSLTGPHWALPCRCTNLRSKHKRELPNRCILRVHYTNVMRLNHNLALSSHYYVYRQILSYFKTLDWKGNKNLMH